MKKSRSILATIAMAASIASISTPAQAFGFGEIMKAVKHGGLNKPPEPSQSPQIDPSSQMTPRNGEPGLSTNSDFPNRESSSSTTPNNGEPGLSTNDGKNTDSTPPLG